MKSARASLGLALCLVLSSCVTSPERESSEEEQQVPPKAVQVERLSGERLRLSFEPVPANPAHGLMTEEEALAVLAWFYEDFPEGSSSKVEPALFTAGPRGRIPSARAAWQKALREKFVARYGPPLLPVPEVLERSPLYMALKLSPRYMGSGVRDAAEEMFKSRAFLASVALSVLVYFAAWVAPEPFFTKAFAAALTVRLALVVGALELRNVALACLQLYREAEAARTLEELEAVAERFGRALGGTGLRVLVMVASFGVARALPPAPPGGLWSLMGTPRFAVAGGLSMGRAVTAHMATDGSIVVAGAALGTASSAAGTACSDGSQKRKGHQWHHLATDKNDLSSAHGGPWTPLFKKLFDRAGMSLDDPANLVYLAAHQGPHPEEYHEEIYRRLLAVVRLCRTRAQCRDLVVAELRRIASEVCTPGSRLHQLVTTR